MTPEQNDDVLDQLDVPPDTLPAPPCEDGTDWPPRPSFPPIVTLAARQALFGIFLYKAQPTASNPESIVVMGPWVANNIERVTIPQLVGKIGAPPGGVVLFHRAVSAQLVALWQAWEDAGLLDRVLSWAGSYAPRFIRGSTSVLSNHAFGTAFDINAPQNGLGAVPALKGHPGSTRELVGLANQHGFFWGGHFDRKDGMHMEAAQIQ